MAEPLQAFRNGPPPLGEQRRPCRIGRETRGRHLQFVAAGNIDCEQRRSGAEIAEDAALTKLLRDEGTLPTGRKVGLVWAGNPEHVNDTVPDQVEILLQADTCCFPPDQMQAFLENVEDTLVTAALGLSETLISGRRSPGSDLE